MNLSRTLLPLLFLTLPLLLNAETSTSSISKGEGLQFSCNQMIWDRVPQIITLEGNVRLSSNEDTTRCAIADQFTYLLEEDKMILTSKDGKNVLFWDKERGLSISAREIHIFKEDSGENVKGIGNVRFSFSSAENALLKKLFPFYDPKKVSE